MQYRGVAKLDKRTKNLVKRLKPGEIAIVDHIDLDRVTAESLLETKVQVVINASLFTSGRYPNVGPHLLSSNGVYLIDNVGTEIFSKVKEGDKVIVRGGRVFDDGKLVAEGEVLTAARTEEKIEKAKESLNIELEKFVTNTLQYVQKEKDWLLEGIHIPQILTDFTNRQALVVVRGYDYKADLKTLRSYIREVKPILIGVDGGADALLEEGLTPNLIIGDMDSVSNEALLSGAELVVHAYPNGKAPGLKRLESLRLSPVVFKAPGTSEDIALLLAYEKGAELVVAVGTHIHLIEFLDKGREGMASTFLVRLKVGSKLVDAKGVSKLYRSTVKISHLLVLLLAALTTFIVIVLASPSIRQLFRLVILNVRSILGF
jgi:uncharacterized membrane-anchored protein